MTHCTQPSSRLVRERLRENEVERTGKKKMGKAEPTPDFAEGGLDRFEFSAEGTFISAPTRLGHGV